MIVDAKWEATIRKSVRDQVAKFNPYHDELGRFTTGGVSSAVADSIIARVKANGGLSVKILTGEEPTDGFMVAQQGQNLEVKEEDFFDAKKGKAALSAYLKAKKLVFGKDQYLGLWWNKDKKEISLDVVDRIKTRSKATKAGRERNQQAIWDVKNQEEINTGGTGDRTTEPTLASSKTSKAFGGDDRSGDRGVRIPSLGKIRTGKQRVVQQTIRAKVFKVSFGGDRSEAGRYAANMRWQGRSEAISPRAKDISKELGLFFGKDPNEYLKSEGYKEIQKREGENQTDYFSDTRLEIIADKQGFSGLPKVVSSEEMTRLEKEGWTIAYRGISTIFIATPNRQTTLNAEDLAEEFRTGKYFGGHGVHGNGTYFATDKEVAQTFAENESETNGTVIKVAIPPNVLMERNELKNEVIKHQDSFKKPSRAFFGDDDIGRVLAAKGVRGARMNLRLSGSFVADVGAAIESNVILIFDRSMLAVEESKKTK